MPQALNIDLRNTAQALYYQGLSPGAVAKKVGVSIGAVSKWISRYAWNTTKTETEKTLSETGQACLAVQVARDMVSESKAVRERISGALQANIEVLEDNPPKTLKDVRGAKGQKGHLELTKLAADTGDRVFGWSSESGGNVKLVQVNILAQVSTAAMDKE